MIRLAWRSYKNFTQASVRFISLWSVTLRIFHGSFLASFPCSYFVIYSCSSSICFLVFLGFFLPYSALRASSSWAVRSSLNSSSRGGNSLKGVSGTSRSVLSTTSSSAISISIIETFLFNYSKTSAFILMWFCISHSVFSSSISASHLSISKSTKWVDIDVVTLLRISLRSFVSSSMVFGFFLLFLSNSAVLFASAVI